MNIRWSLNLQVALHCFTILPIANACFGQAVVPDGTWKWTSEIDNQTIHSVLKLDSDGKKVTGTYADQNITPAISLENGSLEGRNVTAKFKTELEGSVLIVAFRGEVTGDEISGKAQITYDGEDMGEFDWTPKRVVSAADVVGTWNFDFESPDGVQHKPTLVVTEKGGKLAGVLSSDAGEYVAKNVQLKNNTLTFDYEGEYQGSEIAIEYRCKPRGNKLTGEIHFDMGGQTGEFPIAATRRHLSAAEMKLIGEWAFEIVGPDGESHETLLTIANDGGELKAELEGDGREFELENLAFSDGSLRFSFANNHDGTTVDLKWTSKLDTDSKMSGTLEFSVGGETGEIDFSGKRK